MRGAIASERTIMELEVRSDETWFVYFEVCIIGRKEEGSRESGQDKKGTARA